MQIQLYPDVFFCLWAHRLARSAGGRDGDNLQSFSVLNGPLR